MLKQENKILQNVISKFFKCYMQMLYNCNPGKNNNAHTNTNNKFVPLR